MKNLFLNLCVVIALTWQVTAKTCSSCNCEYPTINSDSTGGCNCVNPCIWVKCTADTVCQVDPITLNPQCVPLGTCPNVDVPNETVGACADLCSSDSDCIPGELCCSNGCGHQCTEICPQIACKCRYGTKNVTIGGCTMCDCLEACETIDCKPGYVCQLDSDFNPICVKKYKCISSVEECKCNVGIPMVIVPPDDRECQICSCENPCQKQNCAEGYFCVNQQVVCVRAPCRPVASCVQNRCDIGIEQPYEFCDSGCKSNSHCNNGVCCPDRDPCEKCKIGEQCINTYSNCGTVLCPIDIACQPECPMYKCPAQNCSDGFAFDQNGCQTCDCLYIE